MPYSLSDDTLLRVDEWEQSLTRHPDSLFAGYIVRGLREGFRIGFRRASCLKSSDNIDTYSSGHKKVSNSVP